MRPTTFVLTALLIAAFGFLGWSLHRPSTPRGDAAPQRVHSVAPPSRAEAPLLIVPPAPLPSGAPFLGADGVDPDGYPLRVVDRAAVLSLLWHRRYTELTRLIEDLQSDAEADFRREWWPYDAVGAFIADPRLVPLLDEWVAATPSSFVPLAARGVYHVDAGWRARGEKDAKDTTPEQFAAMEREHVAARSDLERAAALRPKLVSAWRGLIEVANAAGDHDAVRRAYTDGVRASPRSFLLRVARMGTLKPQWGGSYEEMEAFARAEAARAKESPRLALLPGYVELERCKDLHRHHQWDDALAACDRAMASGEHADFLFERGELRLRLHKEEEALGDFERAIALRGATAPRLRERARAELALRQWKASGLDLLGAARLDPVDEQLAELARYAAQALNHAGTDEAARGKWEAALELFDLAVTLDPRVTGARAADALNHLTPSDPTQMEALADRVARAPGDFDLRRQLDYALSKRQDWSRILASWDAYLAIHPDDGRAHVERAGTLRELHRPADQINAAQRGCQLGIALGCLIAERSTAGGATPSSGP